MRPFLHRHVSAATTSIRTNPSATSASGVTKTARTIAPSTYGTGACSSAPPACKQPGKSILLIQKKSQDARDRLVFKWLKGAQTALPELRDPQTSTDYALCVYAGSTPLFEIAIPADASKWIPVSTNGFRYKDSNGTAGGVTNALLKSGEPGKAKAFVKGRGVNLPIPPFGFLPSPVTAKLVNTETNTCFEATYLAQDVKKNDGGRFKARK